MKDAVEPILLDLAPGVELELVFVPAGEFLMGSSDEDEMALSNEKPQHLVRVDQYLIGKYPVTVAQFRAFVQARYYNWPLSEDISNFQHPVTNVSWEDAESFCNWATETAQLDVRGLVMRLPTEAEWERAARGTDGRVFPWLDHNPRNGRYCNFELREGHTTPVDHYAGGWTDLLSPAGCAEMSGNVWEWTHTLYRQYPYCLDDDHEHNRSAEARVLRGGSYADDLRSIRCARRYGFASRGFRGDFVGFRVCVSDAAWSLDERLKYTAIHLPLRLQISPAPEDGMV